MIDESGDSSSGTSVAAEAGAELSDGSMALTGASMESEERTPEQTPHAFRELHSIRREHSFGQGNRPRAQSLQSKLEAEVRWRPHKRDEQEDEFVGSNGHFVPFLTAQARRFDKEMGAARRTCLAHPKRE